jgi:hypothetical protein
MKAVEDRLEILDLIARYSHAADGNIPEEYEMGVLKISSIRWACSILGMISRQSMRSRHLENGAKKMG